MLPSYRISPFFTGAISRNILIQSEFKEISIAYFNTRFGEGNWMITDTGRKAITFAMRLLGVQNEHTVSILTPSHNMYISSCVTSEIEKFCTWNRNPKGSILFINHEFGYLYPEIEKLKSDHVPIIEDCCTTFFSQDDSKKIGLYGDYSVFSFPKFFSIQIGGLLVGNGVGLNKTLENDSNVSPEEKDYILKVVGFELSREMELLEKRKEIFDYASAQFLELGFTLRFPNKNGVVPSVLLLSNNGIIHNLAEHKEFLYKHGIQNSVFYGEDAFFIPCHQQLQKGDIDYFRFVTERFINK